MLPAAAAPSGESLVVLIDRAARECGLGGALTGQTPNGAQGIRVRLESAEFDKLMVCLGNLQQVHAVSIESATIDRDREARPRECESGAQSRRIVQCASA